MNISYLSFIGQLSVLIENGCFPFKETPFFQRATEVVRAMTAHRGSIFAFSPLLEQFSNDCRK